MDHSKRRHVGRVVFASDREWIILTLKSHVENVTALAACWDHEKAYLNGLPLPPGRTKARLITAAEIHDDAKPSHFRLVYKAESQSWEYSFAGHRFAVDYPSDPYIESLVHLHHEYSVEGITTAIASMRNQAGEFPGLNLSEVAALLPLDLYALEMADQIEATVARAAVEAVDPEGRVFMDFQFKVDETRDTTYLVDPFPFLGEQVELEIEYMVWEPTQELLDSVIQARPDARRDPISKLQKALEEAIQHLPLQTKTAVLRPWFVQEALPAGMTNDIDSTYQRLTGFSTPNPMQRDMWKAMIEADDIGIGLMLKGPTGSGKTEAVAIPALASDKRLIMIYPTRSLVDDQIGRMSRILKKLSLSSGRPVSLCVDTGATSERRIWAGGKEQVVTGNVRRHLYHADIIITTLDKFLYRYFGFGEPQKSFIFPLRIHYGLKPTLICFDEAHSYDDVALTNFSRLVRSLYEKGRDVVLMTATMPVQKQHQFFKYLDVIDYVENQTNHADLTAFVQRQFPTRCNPDRHLALVPLDFVENSAPGEIEAVFVGGIERHYSPGQRLIAVIERVQDAVSVWQRLKTMTTGSDPILLYHGRLTQKQRQKVYANLLDRESSDEGYILVTTSAIEVGCDLNAHVLVSQLCDPDRLIQRVGRCNRKQEMTNANVVVIGSGIPSWLSVLSEGDWQRYWSALQAMNGGVFEPRALMSCLQDQTHRIDYRVELMFDMLHEYVYNAQLENRPLHEKGLIITRSWEPSITIATERGERDVLKNAIEVSLRSCKMQEGDEFAHGWHVAKRVYNVQERKQEELDLGGWDCAYSVDLIAYNCDMLFGFDEEIGWAEVPKLFNGGYTQGYRRVIVRESDQRKHQLWYIADLKEPEPVASQIQSEEEDDGSMSDDSDSDSSL